jgi:hypothetical protein
VGTDVTDERVGVQDGVAWIEELGIEPVYRAADAASHDAIASQHYHSTRIFIVTAAWLISPSPTHFAWDHRQQRLTS